MGGNRTEDLATFYLPINVLLLVAVIDSMIDKNIYDGPLKLRMLKAMLKDEWKALA